MGRHSADQRWGRRIIAAVMVVIIVVLGGLLLWLVLDGGHAADDAPRPADAFVEPASHAASGGSAVAMTPQMEAARDAAEELLVDYGDDVALCVMPVDGGEGFSINGDEPFVSASMIKLAVLGRYMQAVDLGDLVPSDEYALRSDDFVGGAGVVAGNAPGTPFTYEHLAQCMIAYSDNTATNILMDTLGIDSINAYVSEQGLEGTQVNRRMMRVDEGVENIVTANDCAQLLLLIAQGSLASEDSCSKAQAWLLAQKDDQGLIRGLPSSVGFGHKTGSLATVRHDGGIVYAAEPYVIVMLTSIEESRANVLMEKVSRAVYEALES